MKTFVFEVEDLPPMKNGAKSMWSDPLMAKRLEKLRKAANEELKGYVLNKKITLVLDIRCSTKEKQTADLDNYITGVCDGLQLAKTQLAYLDRLFLHPKNEDIHPLKTKFIENDSMILKIDAAIARSMNKTSYSIKLVEED